MRLDHAQLIHEHWLHAARCNMKLHVVRVATKDNIADLPSREARPRALRATRHEPLLAVQEFALLRSIGATEVAPVLHDCYAADRAWEELQERWRL